MNPISNRTHPINEGRPPAAGWPAAAPQRAGRAYLMGRAKILIGLAAVMAASLVLAAQQGRPVVQVEKKPKHIPAGPGQKPFDVTRHTIPLREIESGGPPKDGIPALDHPAFVSAAEADRLLHPSDLVLGLEFDGVAKAYPVRILNWHEVVNDDVGSQPVLVSW